MPQVHSNVIITRQKPSGVSSGVAPEYSGSFARSEPCEISEYLATDPQISESGRLGGKIILLLRAGGGGYLFAPPQKD